MRFGEKEIMVKKNTPFGSQPSGAYTHVQKSVGLRAVMLYQRSKGFCNPLTVA